MYVSIICFLSPTFFVFCTKGDWEAVYRDSSSIHALEVAVTLYASYSHSGQCQAWRGFFPSANHTHPMVLRQRQKLSSSWLRTLYLVFSRMQRSMCSTWKAAPGRHRRLRPARRQGGAAWCLERSVASAAPGRFSSPAAEAQYHQPVCSPHPCTNCLLGLWGTTWHRVLQNVYTRVATWKAAQLSSF